jgi:hypothetical protein
MWASAAVNATAGMSGDVRRGARLFHLSWLTMNASWQTSPELGSLDPEEKTDNESTHLLKSP